ncbi:MAG: hypothetical protein WA159_21030 [Variovorax sp.]
MSRVVTFPSTARQPKAPSPLSRRMLVVAPWMGGWGFAGVALVCLTASTVLLVLGSRQATSARHDAVRLESLRAERITQARLSALGEERSALEKRLMSRVVDAGARAGDWDERRLNIKQVTMSRAEVNAMVGEVAWGPGRLFAAERFELSVTGPTEGLFGAGTAEAELSLSLKGRLLFRAGAGGS